MTTSDDRETRLRAEADAQNRRVAAAQGEGRDRYYFLAERAFARYRHYLADVTGKALPPLAYLAWTCVIRCRRPLRPAASH